MAMKIMIAEERKDQAPPSPTECTRDKGKKRAFWAALDKAATEVPKHEQLFVLIEANARTGRRRSGRPASEHYEVLSAYSRDTRNEIGEHLLAFASNHDIALVNTCFSTPQTGISHTFNGIGNRKRIDHILTRQRDRNSCGTLLCTLNRRFSPSRTTMA